MAQKVITTLVDDLDGTVIEEGKGETLQFGLEGTTYEIDLTSQNAESLRDALAPFIAAARSPSRGSRPQPAPSASGSDASASGQRNSKEELAAAREWLRSEGHKVSDRGRIQGGLLELFRNSKR